MDDALLNAIAAARRGPMAKPNKRDRALLDAAKQGHTPTPKNPSDLTPEDRGIPCRTCGRQLRAIGAEVSGLVKWEHRAGATSNGDS